MTTRKKDDPKQSAAFEKMAAEVGAMADDDGFQRVFGVVVQNQKRKRVAQEQPSNLTQTIKTTTIKTRTRKSGSNQS